MYSNPYRSLPSSVLDEKLHDIGVIFGGYQGQCQFAIFVHRIDISTFLDEKLHDIGVTTVGCPAQCRPAVLVDSSTFLDEKLRDIPVSIAA